MANDKPKSAAQIDAENKENAQRVKDMQESGPKNAVVESVPVASDLDQYKDGVFVKKDATDAEGKPESYKLRIVEDDPYGRTHKLKNATHFWEGTKLEFKNQFEKP